MPRRLAHVSAQIHALFAEIMALPRDRDSYGLIHGDFNDRNFTVDFTNGNITVFDFDDCCYFWFVYELAAAWEGGVGRTMFAGLEQRRAFMDRYMEQVLAGYSGKQLVGRVAGSLATVRQFAPGGWHQPLPQTR